MIIDLCIKIQSNTPICSKDVARKPFVSHNGRTGPMGRTDVRMDSSDTTGPPIENGGGIKTDN